MGLYHFHRAVRYRENIYEIIGEIEREIVERERIRVGNNTKTEGGMGRGDEDT